MLRKLLVLIALLLAADVSYAISVQGGLTRDLVVAPGSTVKTQIQISNPTDKQQGVKVYLQDYQSFADGKTVYSDPKTLARSNAGWVKISPDMLVIPPNGKGVVDLSVTAPANQSIEGSYWSMLMIEGLDEQAPELTGVAANKGGVQFIVKTRYGVHLHASAGTSGKKSIKFANRQLVNEPDKRFFLVDIENNGTKMIRGQATLQLFDSSGKPVKTLESPSSGRVYPACSARLRFDFSGIPSGKYTGLCVVDTDNDDVFGARYQIEVP